MMQGLMHSYASLSVSKKEDQMADLTEKMARDIAVVLNGGEFNDGRWYGEGHRTAWRNAVKPYAEEIEQNRIDLEEYRRDVERLRAALDKISNDNWFFIEDAKGIACAALNSKGELP